MSFFGTSRRVARRTSRRTSRRWGMWNRMSDEATAAEQQPQRQSDSYTQPPQEGDPIVILKLRLAKGEITPEQYDQSIKLLQGG
jgi:hypothetical protein